MRELAGCLLFVGVFSVAGAAEFTTLPPLTGEGVERGVALVRCTTAAGYDESRGAVLDVGVSAGADVILTAGHGLPAAEAAAREDCRVYARGKAHPIEALWRPGGTSPRDDWAVLVVRRIGGAVNRLRVEAISEATWASLATDGAPLRFVLRYAAGHAVECHFHRMEAAAWPLLPHTCSGYPGTSGSPLVVGRGFEPVVIGVHIGAQTLFDGRRFEFARIARALDADILAAIDAAASRASEPVRRRRR